ncbi:hypothetical protein ACOZ4L_02760 [Haloplanus ruber]|uniref:Uncharacterized protein n=1 Tax=Haloplanus ruber TaxID=869892 RepID=A0ABD6D133_9EURY|nr:hypothetical protein [Haloplanus ruber]
MVIEELLARAIESGAGLLGAHGVEAGLIATAVIVVWHGHSALALISRVLRTARIGFVGAALVGLLLVVSIAMGWMDVASLPSLGSIPFLSV